MNSNGSNVKKRRFALKVIICTACVFIIAAAVVLGVLYANGTLRFVSPVKSDGGKYLFAYCSGEEGGEVRMAVSEDGYSYTSLLGGASVIDQTLGEQSAADPYLFRAADGAFRIIAADAAAGDDRQLNHSLVTWSSTDLITWTAERIVDLRNFEGFESCSRAWSPQVLTANDDGEYFVYFAASKSADGSDDPELYYCFTKDFKKYTAPKPLYSLQGQGVTDPDIVFNSADGNYYLFFRSENTSSVSYVTAKSPAGPYATEPVAVSLDEGAGGSSLFAVSGTDTYVLALYNYIDGGFSALQTTDLARYSKLKRSDFVLPGDARQGSFLQITDAQYDQLIAAFGTELETTDRLITPFETEAQSE